MLQVARGEMCVRVVSFGAGFRRNLDHKFVCVRGDFLRTPLLHGLDVCVANIPYQVLCAAAAAAVPVPVAVPSRTFSTPVTFLLFAVEGHRSRRRWWTGFSPFARC